MDRTLGALSPQFRPLACEILARLVEARIPVVIVGTRRTAEEQAQLVAAGRSWTEHSRHLTGDAIDVAPIATWMLHGPNKLLWDRDDRVWEEIAGVVRRVGGVKIGVVVGGRQVDPGHIELAERP